MNSAEKKEILSLIKEKWSEINADFSDKGSDRHTRENAWKEMFEECKSKGHTWTAKYDHKYLSGSKWPTWRAEFNRKMARNKKTGSGGDTRLNEFDELIQEIIGKDSPDIATLGVPESFAGQAAETDFLAKQKLDTPGTSSQNCVLDEQTPRAPKRSKLEYSGTSSKDSLDQKRSRLLDLEIELKKRQIYKADLEIHFLERDLQIPHRFLHITPNLDIGANVTLVEDDLNSEHELIS
ncbi:hypothetical protein Ddc_17207 [Ditylenchus destructor]|nr:hypothetical protein Ddc_17207 [Ditylenchus destructor]